IIGFRSIYNSNASSLVDRMADENSSDDDKMDIIIAMEKSEQNRGEEATSLTNDARRTVAMQFYINRLNKIMAQCCELVEQGKTDSTKYAQALELVKDCLPPVLKTSESDIIYHGETEIPVKYDNSLVKDVDACVKRINSRDIAALISRCESVYAQFIAAVQSGDPIGAYEIFEKLSSEFKALAQARNEIYREGQLLSKLNDRAVQQQVAIQKAHNMNTAAPDTTYVAFGKWGVLGVGDYEDRKITGADTGLIGIIDSYYNTRVEAMKENIAVQISSNFTQMKSVLPEGNIFTEFDARTVNDARNRIISFSQTAKSSHALYSNLADYAPAGWKEFDASMDFIAELARDYRTSVNRVREITARNTSWVLGEDKNYDAYTKSGLALIDFYAKKLEECKASLKGTFLNGEKQKEDKVRLQPPDTGRRTTAGVEIRNLPLLWTDEIAAYEYILEETSRECAERQTQFWITLSKAYSDEADARYLNYTITFAEAKKKSGAGDGGQAGGNRPSKVIAVLAELNASVAESKKMLTGFTATLDKGAAYREKDGIFDRSYINIENVIKNLDTLTADSLKLSAACQERVNLARIASREADNFYNRAVRDLQNAIKKGDNDLFNSARENMNNARKRYTDSIGYEDDEELKNSSDEKLSRLDNDINENQQKIVVARTRQLKNSAREAYYNGDFEEAERNLTLARTMWAITNGNNLDQETESLLAMVNRALTMKTGRTIPVTAPLYPEMSQILNAANQYYDEGARLKRQGKDSEAEKVLNAAKEKLRILQIVYPLNQDASLLTLKIDKLLDPKKFEKDFAQKVSQAIAGAKNQATQQQSYADLEDLSRINPKYPGIASTMLELEYELGIKSRPVTNTSVTRSNALYNEALRIYNSSKGNEARLSQAVSKLDEAISLNPRNTNASSLKDKISTEIGGRATSILKAEDERTYRQIIQVMNDGNLINALAMTEQLMQKGSNSRNKQLQDFRNRIRGLLGMN
ncbi:MAG: hypothetical protein J6Y93_02250, partial [Treponema sp.]|nr:hypothetical protein [Treponema sp.]